MRGVLKMVSKNKMSKSAQKELNNQKRTTWTFSPVTRVKQSKKLYDRKAGKTEILQYRGV